MELWQAIVLAVVEGLTEYLPISSTGHIIVSSALLGINENPFVKDFTVMVQFGAILSVVFLFWRRFLQGMPIYVKLFAAFLPTAIVGLALKNKIDSLLGNVAVVAWSFVIGGIVILVFDRWLEKRAHLHSMEAVTPQRAVGIGFAQCLAIVPGVSRSAATILGGMGLGLDRKVAAEFSFLLAVPTLTAASALKLHKILPTIQHDQILSLVVGNIVSFIVGVITIKAFIGYLSKHGFKIFGIYRIVVGLLILAWLWTGHSLAMM